MHLKYSIAPIFVATLGVIGSASAQDLMGTYGYFSEAALKSVALESFGKGLDDGEHLDGSALDYFSFGVHVSAEYDSNIYRREEDKIDDIIVRVSIPLKLSNPGGAVNQWSLGYTPSFNFHLTEDEENGDNHSFNAGYSRSWAKTSLNFGFTFNRTKGSDRFASGLIQQNNYGSNVSVSRKLTGKSRLDLDMGLNVNDFSDPSLFDRSSYNTRLAWQYQMTGKTTIGPYIAYQGVKVQKSNPDHTAISGGVTGTYKAFQKTVFTGYIGAEVREFDEGNIGNKTSPTFEFGASHQLSGKTSLSGSIYHNIRASYSEEGESYTATGVNFSANYSYTARLNFNAGVVYEYDDYFAVSEDGGADHSDHYISLFFGSHYTMPNGLMLNAGINYSLKDSSQIGSDFDNVLLDVGAHYNF